MKPETIVVKQGYEYILVESIDRTKQKIPSPCMFGMEGMALKAVRKVKTKTDKESMTENDLWIKYHRNTGKYTPCMLIESLEDKDIRDYINWLESEIVKLANLKNRLIPFEKLDENPKLIHK